MSKILIADQKKGAERLTRILSTRHQLLFAEQIQQVVEIANHEPLDLLIVGILFDESRMYEMVRVAKSSPVLAGVPVIGFSDEHTNMTVAGRDAVETIMHLIGATDYIDTRGMDDREILQRIEMGLEEKKSLSRKVQPAEQTPAGKRQMQEQARLSSQSNALSRQTPYAILLISKDAGLAADLKVGLKDVSGVHFSLEVSETLQAGVKATFASKLDALVCDFDSLQDEESSEAILIAQNTPVIALSKNASDQLVAQAQAGNFFQILPRQVDELTIAVAVLTAVNRDNNSEEHDSNVAAFLLSKLQTALKSLERHELLDKVLNAFCAELEEFGRISLRDEFFASVLMLNADGETLQTVAAPSLVEAYTSAINGMQIGDNAGSCGTAAFLRQPVYVSDTDSDPRWKNFRALAKSHGLRACWSIPIFGDNQEVLGTFAIYHSIPRLPSNAELKLVGAAATAVATIFAHSRKLSVPSIR